MKFFATLITVCALPLCFPWGSTAQAAWETTDFKVEYALPPRNHPFWDLRDVFIEGIDSVILDDLSDDQKLANAAWQRLAERHLSDIAKRFSEAGLKEPVHLPRDEETGRYMAYVYPFDKFNIGIEKDPNAGVAHTNMCDPLGRGAETFAINSEVYNYTNTSKETDEPEAKGTDQPGTKETDGPGAKENREFYETLAHELFHAVQFQYDRENKSVRFCDVSNPVQVEGTAMAVGAYLTEQRFPGYLEETDDRRVLGVWAYKLTFLEADKFGFHGEDELGRVKAGYYTSAFWRFLMERYGGLRVMDHLFRVSMPGTGSASSQNVTDWLDKGLQRSRLIDLPLYIVFPEFSADLVEWAKERYSPSVMPESEWFTAGTMGCGLQPLELSPEKPSQQIELEMGEITFSCVRIKATGFKENQIIAVKAIAYADQKEKLDALHMGVGRMLSRKVDDNQPYHCYQFTRHMGYTRVPVCLEKPYLGRKSWIDAPQGEIERRLAGQFEQGEADGAHTKTWAAHAQYWDPTFENVITIARVAPVPKLGEYHKYKVEFAVDFAAMKTSEGVDTHSPGVDINLPGNTNPVPIDESELMQQYPSKNDITQMIFLQQGGMGMAKIALREAFDGGVGVITFVSADMDNADDQELLGADQFQVGIANGGVPFGKTGTFDVGITPATSMTLGADGHISMIMGLMQDRPDGTIEIKQFDEQLLRGTLNISYCRMGNFDFDRMECTKIETASLEFSKPFGWTYDMDQSFISIDSPGMRMYRKLSGDKLFGDSGLEWSEIQELGWNPIPPRSSATSPGATGVGSAGTAAGGSEPPLCTCTCSELKEISEAADRMNETLGEDQMPDFNDKNVQRMMTCAMQCTVSYAQCDG